MGQVSQYFSKVTCQSLPTVVVGFFSLFTVVYHVLVETIWDRILQYLIQDFAKFGKIPS